MTTGQLIKAARKAAGMTQAELSSKLGIPYQSIGQWERDLRNPKRETLQRIAVALEVPLWQLIPPTNQEPDRDYERVCDTLADAGLSIEAAGFGDGSGPDGDYYYVWHKDAEATEEDRVELPFRDLLRIVNTVQRDADLRRIDYLRKRLDAELF